MRTAGSTGKMNLAIPIDTCEGNGAFLRREPHVAVGTRYRCDQCESSFRRAEHLVRHQRTHENVKPYTCKVCSKSFSRSDTAARHETIHRYDSEQRSSPQQANMSHRLNRACSECAKARARCSKGRICARCAAKSLHCIYPGRRRRAIDSTADRTDEHPAQLADDNLNDPAIDSRPTTDSLGRDDIPVYNTAIDFPSAAVVSAIPPGPGQEPDPNAFQHPVANREGSFSTHDDLSMMFDVMTADVELPMNWLPANFNANVDYSSILGLQFGPNNTVPNSLNQTLPTTTSLPNSFPVQPLVESSASLGPQDMHRDSTVSVATGDESSKGTLYATSTDGARIPCAARFKRPDIPVYGSDPITPRSLPSGPLDDTNLTAGFPNVNGIVVEGFSISGSQILGPSVCGLINDAFTRACLQRPGTLLPSFENAHFPLNSHLNYFAYLYFEFFHPVFSIINNDVTVLNDDWLLALGVISIGCRFTETEVFYKCIIPMQEFFRRVLTIELETRPMDLSLITTLLLSHIGMLYSGSSKFAALDRGNHGRLIDIVHQFGLLSDPGTRIKNGHGSLEGPWKEWIRTESSRRLGYAIWLVDCMRYYHFGLKPSLSVADGQVPLPDDDLWNAKSAAEWSALSERREENPSLITALQRICVEGRVKQDIGETSRILILHSIYHETWDMARYFKRPLAFWQSSAGRQQCPPSSHSNASSAVAKLGRSRWLPEVPTYSSWRNAACDYVDVLHWSANATIAQLNGIEHPTVSHLHFSRVVLLVPHEMIRSLAVSIVAAASISNIESKPFGTLVDTIDPVEAEHEVINWAQRDEHKARLAMIHAGCLLWHIRRYSMRAFYEPTAVFLATLSLWAYSSYTHLASRKGEQDKTNGTASRHTNDHARDHGMPQQQGNHDPRRDSIVNTSSSPASSSSSTASEPEPYSHDPDSASSPSATPPHSTSFSPQQRTPSFILLDRPNDDEMVQLFVRAGHPSRIRAYISGVGNICSPKGPYRILREGRRLLAGLTSAWGIGVEYMSLLEGLERAAKEHERGKAVNNLL